MSTVHSAVHGGARWYTKNMQLPLVSWLCVTRVPGDIARDASKAHRATIPPSCPLRLSWMRRRRNVP